MPQAAWALGTPKVTTGGGLKRNRNRIAPLNGPVQYPAEIKTTEHFSAIPKTIECKLAH